MHGFDHPHILDAGVLKFTGVEESRDHSRHLATCRQYPIGHRPHHAHAAPTVDSINQQNGLLTMSEICRAKSSCVAVVVVIIVKMMACSRKIFFPKCAPAAIQHDPTGKPRLDADGGLNFG